MSKLSEEDAKDLLQKKLDVLRKNKENIPLCDQKGKYRRAFDKLRGEISNALYQMMKEQCFYYWCKPENKIEIRNYFLELLQKSNLNQALASYDADACEKELVSIKDSLIAALIKKNDMTYSPERCCIDPFNPQKMIESSTGSGYMIISDC